MTTQIKARILSVQDMGNRIYKLELDAPENVKSASVNLSLEGQETQEPYFSLLNGNKSVDAIAHNCSDFGDPSIYYVWQPRLPGMPHTCPRCKTRMDKSWGNHRQA